VKTWWTRQDPKRWGRRPLGREQRIGLGVVLGALAGLVVVPPAAALEVTVRTADGEEGFGRLVSFSLADGLEWQPGDSNMVRVSSDEVVSITVYDHPVGVPTDGALVHLTDGGRVFGELGDGDEEGLALTNPLLGRLRIPLERVAAVITERGRGKLSASTVRAALRPPDREADELWFANGDRLSGSLLLITGQKVMVETELGGSEASAEFLLGVFLAGASPSADQEPRLRAILRLVDASELPAQEVRWYGPDVQAAAEGWIRTSFASRHLAGVEVLGGRWRWLGDLTPSEYTQTSLTAMKWPYRVDANVLDEPMRINGRTYTRGIGLHSAARLAYYLGGEYEAFSAQVGIDDSAGPFADADFEVRVDERTAFRAKGLGRGAPAVPVRLDIAGAQRLEIAVDFGRNADIQDRVNLADAALIRKPAPTAASPLP